MQKVNRRTHLFLCTVIMVGALAWSLASGSERPDRQPKPTGEVEQVIKGIIAADNAGDLEKAISYYASDAVLISPSGPDIAGIAKIREHYATLFAENALTISNEILDTVISGKWAISRGVNRVTATSSHDGTRSSAISKYLMTLRREADGEWKIVHLMWANAPAQTESED